jgi:Bacteriophage tail sheath protein
MGRAKTWIGLALLMSAICTAQEPTRPSAVASRPAGWQSSQSQYIKYLQNSLTKGTEWAVFENNNTQLWGKVRQTANNFLTNEWQQGKLKGSRSQEAFFVKCDATTMTQNDLDNGRLVLVAGVATVRPGEFTVIRITQHTGRRK